MIDLDFHPFNYFSPEKNMAIDKHFLTNGEGFVFRLYRWKPYSVSIGFSQHSNKVCNMDYCSRMNIPVVKRITGGGAVYHKNDITYMFSCPLDFFREKTVVGVYKTIAGYFLQIFKDLGIDCCFAGSIERKTRIEGMRRGIACFLLPSDYEILVDGKKIIGNALRIEKNRIMQHGSIAFDFDFEETATVLNSTPHSLKKRVVSLKQLIPNLTVNKFEKVCIKVFSKNNFNVKIRDDIEF